MKYWFGYLTAAIFGAITFVLLRFGERFSTLVDMVYPYVIRTWEGTLAQWSSAVSFPIWQLLTVALGALILCSLVLMIVLKWNPVQWLGWVIAVFAGIYMLHTLLWGLNYYAGPLAEDMRLETASYTLEELTEAAEYYRDRANDLSGKVNRDSNGNVSFDDFDVLAEHAGEGFETLTYKHHYPVFAGSRLPVKKLGWADTATLRMPYHTAVTLATLYCLYAFRYFLYGEILLIASQFLYACIKLRKYFADERL